MLKRVVFSIALGLVATQGAYAGSIISFNSGDGASYRTDDYNVGVEIQVGSTDQTVTALGGQAYGSGGTDLLLSGMKVGLWDASDDSLLASVTVSSTDTLNGSYRYVTLGTPITLTHGHDYYLGAHVGGASNHFVDGNANSTLPYSANSGFSIIKNAYYTGGTLHEPTFDGGGSGGKWSPANALTQDAAAVPEPSTSAWPSWVA